MNNDHVMNNGLLPPSPQIMSELGAAAENLNHPKEGYRSGGRASFPSRRLYRRWIDKT